MSAPYNYDVVVVGAGPAGLAAATRVRWVKGFHALAGSVCLVESGVPGGLLRWGSCVLTGPSWAYSGEDLTEILLNDIERLHIPLIADQVVRVNREGPLLHTTLQSGRVLSSPSVVLATGFRPLANESDYYLKGVRITFKGYEHFPSIVRACARDAEGRGLVIIGNEKTAHLKTILNAHAEGCGGFRIIDRGTLLNVLGDDRVEAVQVQEDESIRTIGCGAVLMDYNGFELNPSFDITGLNLKRDERGFVLADSRMGSSEEGVFVAGDLTGRYASTLMALGDGVCAGLSAYAHAFERKFGHPPNLFAYTANDEALPANPVDLPTLPDTAVPVLVGEGPAWVDGERTLAEHAKEQGISVDTLRDRLQSAIAEKNVTVHHLHHEAENS